MSARKAWLWPEPRKQQITDWILRMGVALFFVAVGLDKFAAKSDWPRIFARIGWGEWFRYTTGVVEALGGLLMLLPRTTRLGAALLACTMLGAIGAHVLALGDPAVSIIPAALLIIIVALGWKLSEGPDEYGGLRL